MTIFRPHRFWYIHSTRFSNIDLTWWRHLIYSWTWPGSTKKTSNDGSKKKLNEKRTKKGAWRQVIVKRKGVGKCGRWAHFFNKKIILLKPVQNHLYVKPCRGYNTRSRITWCGTEGELEFESLFLVSRPWHRRYGCPFIDNRLLTGMWRQKCCAQDFPMHDSTGTTPSSLYY